MVVDFKLDHGNIANMANREEKSSQCLPCVFGPLDITTEDNLEIFDMN